MVSITKPIRNKKLVKQILLNVTVLEVKKLKPLLKFLYKLVS